MDRAEQIQTAGQSEPIRIGSRDSALAIRQSELVMERLEDVPTVLLTRKTVGDRLLDRPLESFGGKGAFIGELLEDMRNGLIDLAVHSLKDMEAAEDEQFPIVAYLPREDASDVLVLPQGVTKWDMSKPVGCSGRRRAEQLKRLYPEIHCEPIRGNVPTRLKKLDNGEYGALVLAAAGLKRLGLEERISRYFLSAEILPAAGQGIIAVQACREWMQDAEHQNRMRQLNDERTEILAMAERTLIRTLEGGCHQPIAGHAVWLDETRIRLEGLYCLPEQGVYRKAAVIGEAVTADQAERLAKRLAERLRAGQDLVSLVGAGPGAGGLLTVAGREALKQADAVLYDSLVEPEVLQYLPMQAELIHVGKRMGAHSVDQAELNRLLVDTAKLHSRVVRLKGGDPFLFGRGGEEAEALVQNGLTFAVIPGVTAGLSVPAYAGMPVTFRGKANAVHLITGHLQNGEMENSRWQVYAALDGTLVFYMAVTAIPQIVGALLKYGKNGATAAALLIRGTTARACRISGKLDNIADAVAAYSGDKTPGLFVVGDIADLTGLEWYRPLPLAGKTLAVSRPRQAASSLTERLRALGAAVYEIEAICTESLIDTANKERYREWLAGHDWLVLTSPSAVYYLAEALAVCGLDSRALSGCRIAVT
ncbi:MAG: uroporphyrinogen-III C-methyltransferase, partial [Lachnospiraceae bacterium]|nr:uroporphyrinogen-III C-methyltransferase [Lachnospiraceae bacterium]